jgi:hypothetical protein
VYMHASGSGECLGELEAQSLDPTWRPAGVRAGLALCAAPRQPRPTPTPAPTVRGTRRGPMLVVHTVASYAVNERVAARIARAHVELSHAGHLHRVALAAKVCLRHEVCGEFDLPAAQSADSRASAAIQSAVASGAGSTRSGLVTLIGRDEINRAFPRLLRQSHGIKWGDRRRPKWLSNGCDLVGLAWFALHGTTIDAPHVWMLQHDVGWSGGLPAVLAAPDALSRQAAPADLVCLDLSRKRASSANATWAHAAARNPLHLERYRDQLSSCLLPVARYSRRLMSALVDELRAGITTYCEARAATACAAQPWCIAADLRDSGLLGPFSYYTSLNESAQALGSWAATGTEDPQDACAQSGGVGRLYHRVA